MADFGPRLCAASGVTFNRSSPYVPLRVRRRQMSLSRALADRSPTAVPILEGYHQSPAGATSLERCARLPSSRKSGCDPWITALSGGLWAGMLAVGEPDQLD